MMHRAAAALSFSQESLWFLEQLHPGTARHHIYSAWTIRGPLDADALRRALGTVCGRHSALRTIFVDYNGTPGGFLLDRGPDAVERDWSMLSPGQREQAFEEECRRPFDLASEAPVRFLLARTAAEEQILLMVFHHIAVDGWSLGVFHSELSACYGCYRRGEDPALDPAPPQFHEHAARERARLDHAELERLAAPWIERLAGVPPLNLPSRPHHERPAEESGANVFLQLGSKAVQGARAWARTNRTSPYAVYLAALQALLARYSGQSDFALGTAYANRGEPDLEKVVGFFVNTLLMRAGLGDGPSFRTLAGRVSAGVFDALEGGEFPFSQLVERLQPQRSRGANPLYNVLFAYQNFPGAAFALEGAELHELRVGGTAPPPADLSMTLTPRGDEVELWLRYSERVFDAAAARRFAAHYANLLEAALDSPDVPLPALEFLDVQERARILEQGTGPRSEYPRAPVHAVFAAQARATPQRPAVREGGETLSYAELDARANRLARLLAARGLAPGGYVGVLAPRGLRLVECWLAVLKAGCAYLPLDPADPVERLAAQLSDCGAGGLIALAPPPELAGAVAVCADLSRCGAELAAQPDAPLEAPCSPQQAACVMFSSGSTGRPKGAAVPHRGILRLLFDNGYAKFEADDTWLFMAPPSFDASTLEVWGPLLNGGCCVVLPAGIPSLAALGDTILGHRITVLWLTSSLFNAIVDDEPEVLRGVRLLMTGGEALSAPHVRKAQRLLPETRLLNGYGPTENTTFTTCWEISRELPETAASVPIGRPIANTRVYVLDAARRLVPAGVPGELYAGGDGVALGYLGLPELTAERFLPDPFAEEPGRTMYRTGDVVRWQESGVLEFLGRTDDQVKIRGHRVEPGELEAALQAHPAVRQACAAVGEDAATGKFLLVYYTLSRPVAGGDLRQFLETRLPHFLLPRELVELAALPLLPSGKVDRGALASLWTSRHAAAESANLEAPQPGWEERVAAVWRRLLGRKIISRSDDFFELGGNSLAAVRLVAMLRKEMHAQLQVADVFTSPVLSSLAAVVAKGAAPRKEAIVLQAAGARIALHSLSAGPRFRNLAHCFAPERPVLALPAPDLKELTHPCRCEDLAARYAEWLMTAQPGGPWVLTGWCMAGVVAFEAARLLAAHGPGAVVLLDSPCPEQNRSQPPLQRLARSARNLAYHGRVILSGRHGGLAPYLRERIATLQDQRTLRAFEKRYQVVSSDEQGFEFQDVLNFAASRYAPGGPLPWPVLLLRAEERAHDREKRGDWGWGPYAPRLDVAWSEGDHGTIFEAPYVSKSARLIRDWLDRIPEIS